MEDLLASYGLTRQPEPEQPDQIRSLFSKYFENDYISKAEEAKRKRDELLAAYKGSLAGQAQVPLDEPSKAERYFRLTQALLDPGKTGHFYESLGNVARTSADIEKERRTARRQQAMDALKAASASQQLDIEAAGADIDLYSKLAEKGETTRGNIMQELIKQSMKPREAQSPAGKQAMDEGLVPGTPAFHKRVAAIAQASGDAAEARLNMAMANATLAQARFERQGTEMSSKEIDLMTSTEGTIRSADTSEQLLLQALELNEIAYGTNPADLAARAVAERTNPTNPKVVATRDLENILQQRALEQLKITFPGAISDAERQAMMQLQGIEAKSKEERKRIINRALEAVRKRREYEQGNIKKIQSGFYRYRSSPEATE